MEGRRPPPQRGGQYYPDPDSATQDRLHRALLCAQSTRTAECGHHIDNHASEWVSAHSGQTRPRRPPRLGRMQPKSHAAQLQLQLQTPSRLMRICARARLRRRWRPRQLTLLSGAAAAQLLEQQQVRYGSLGPRHSSSRTHCSRIKSNHDRMVVGSRDSSRALARPAAHGARDAHYEHRDRRR